MASVPPLLLVGTAIICLGDLLHIIGLGSPHWQETGEGIFQVSYGLFKACNKDECGTYEKTSSDLKSVQAMAVIGMLCGLLAGVAALGYLVLSLLSKSPPKIMTLVCVGACGAAFVFIIIGVIIYGDKIYNSDGADLGYSFGLCIVGAILLAVGGVLVFQGGKSMG